MKMPRVVVAIMLIGLLAGCAKKASMEPAESGARPASVAGETTKTGAFLSYEHEVAFRVAPDSMSRRVGAVQAACNDERFGECSVLAIESASGEYAHASIMVRVVPAGVEKLVALAGEGDAIEKRQTRAEDLADAVADVASRQELLRRQRETLLGFVERKDIAVADMIALSQQLASVESQLQSLAQDAAGQRRRIETNRLTIELASNATDDEDGFSLRDAWDTFTDSLVEGIDGAAEYVGYFLPLLLVLFPFALLWRWAWRWATRKSRAKATDGTA